MPVRRKGGFFLLETAVAVVISTVLFGAILAMLRSGQDNARSVWKESRAMAAMRNATNRLRLDMRQAGRSVMFIGTGTDGNHQLTLQRPVSLNGGHKVWGIYAAALGRTESERMKADWRIRYRVLNRTTASGRADRQLVRQLLDPGNVVRRQATLVHFLQTGTDTPRGFSIVRRGNLWRVTISSRIYDGNEFEVKSTSFNVKQRN
ncbi:MAG: type II secretion system protein J [Planctomycetota bacterium]